MASITTGLGAAAEERKARLAQLRNLKRKQRDDDSTTSARPAVMTRRSKSPAGELVHDADRSSSSNSRSFPAGASAPAQDAETAASDDMHIAVANIVLSGRTYDPVTRGPKLGFEHDPTAHGDTLEARAREIEADVRAQQEADAAADADAAAGAAPVVDLFKLRPKNPCWDLRRDLDAKLRILNPRTQNAINKLVRDRIAAQRAAPDAAGKKKNTDLKMAHGGDVVKSAADSRDAPDTESSLDGPALAEALRRREQQEDEDERIENEALAAEGES